MSLMIGSICTLFVLQVSCLADLAICIAMTLCCFVLSAGTPSFATGGQVASCDVKGKPRQFEREMLFSKVDKVSDVVKQLSEANKVHTRPRRLQTTAER